MPGSNKKVWWKCTKDPAHEWQTRVVHRAKDGTGCPMCSGRQATPITSLQFLNPRLAAEWHPTKNKPLTPNDVVPGSSRKAWWQCGKDSLHQWQTTIANRTVLGHGCPMCSGRQATPITSLQFLNPRLAAEWHPIKNEPLTPNDVVPGSTKKLWWRCSKNPSHEWKAAVWGRAKLGHGCPMCVGHITTSTTSLKALYPQLAAEWHPTKNLSLTPDDVMPRSNKKIWWRCSLESSHEWQATVQSRTHGGRPKKGQAKKGTGCPMCSGQRATLTTSLITQYPKLAAEWHPTKNGPITPNNVMPGSSKRVWWKCSKDPAHEWQAQVSARARGTGCPMCSGRTATPTTSLLVLYPRLAAEWHATKNAPLTPNDVVPGSPKKVWWQCTEDPLHEWEAEVQSRTRLGTGCPMCSGRTATPTTSLLVLYPDLAAEWHPTKNAPLTPDQVLPSSGKKVWWQCTRDISHQYQSTVANRMQLGQGCPACNRGWSINAIRGFVASLTHYLGTLTPAELYILFQQNGLLDVTGKGKAFVKALATGRFPIEEVAKFADGNPSLVDAFLADTTQTLEAHESTQETTNGGNQENTSDNPLIEPSEPADDGELPVVHAKKVLASLDAPVVTSADQEAVEFLLESAKAKIWRHIFHDEAEAIAQLEAYSGGNYAEKVRSEFLNEYHESKNLRIPDKYSFSLDNRLTPPNLMQRLVSVRLKQRRRIGNWSGTGAGKTLSAILAGRVVGAKFTVVCCPNSVVEGWKNAILEIFPDSVVDAKTFTPDWSSSVSNETGIEASDQYRYLILNYEAFQQPDSQERVESFVAHERLDFVVVDEIHYTKQRLVENMSKRKQLVMSLIGVAARNNPELYVLGMSATPVINNLQEGKSLVDLVTGTSHDDLDTRATVPNCMRLHQQLVRLGTRWLPEYDIKCEIETPGIDCSSFVHEIRALGTNGTPLALEQILTRARLPVIRKEIESKTLVYTHYIQGIDRVLWQALRDDGWKVGFYTGDDKSGLDDFIEGDLDVLIGSPAIATGLDGLQKVCSKLIVNVLPWTNAEFEQLKGRVYRQGQTQDRVKVVIPITYADINGNRWSWCESKMNRLRFKKSIADAVVDGVVPEGHLRTPAQAYQDVMGWLERLESGQATSISRPKIIVPLPGDNKSDLLRRQHRYGDFSTMNRAWNQSHSHETHERLQKNPEEWEQYHTLYRESRKEWAVIPFEEIIRWCERRSDYVIGDFGCGEAKLAEALSDRHTVYSFDHIAINWERHRV